jgi:hypothetical protein
MASTWKSWPHFKKTPIMPSPDIELEVRSLPGGISEKTVMVITRIGTDGHIATCEASEKDDDSLPLTEVACAQAKRLVANMIKDDDGRPISVVKDFEVSFRAPKP